MVLCKEKGMKTPQIQAGFVKKWPETQPPDRTTIYRYQKALHRNKTLSDQRKGKSGRVTVRNQENIDAVQNLLESELNRKPDQPVGGTSSILASPPFIGLSRRTFTGNPIK